MTHNDHITVQRDNSIRPYIWCKPGAHRTLLHIWNVLKTTSWPRTKQPQNYLLSVSVLQQLPFSQALSFSSSHGGTTFQKKGLSFVPEIIPFSKTPDSPKIENRSAHISGLFIQCNLSWIGKETDSTEEGRSEQPQKPVPGLSLNALLHCTPFSSFSGSRSLTLRVAAHPLTLGGTKKPHYLTLTHKMRKPSFFSSFSAPRNISFFLTSRKMLSWVLAISNNSQTGLAFNSIHPKLNNTVWFSFVFIFLWPFIDGNWCGFST